MRINTTGQMLRTFGALVLVAAAAISCDRSSAPEPSTAAPDVTTAAPGLTSAESDKPKMATEMPAGIEAPAEVKTRLGTLRTKDGVPDKATNKKD